MFNLLEKNSNSPKHCSLENLKCGQTHLDPAARNFTVALGVSSWPWPLILSVVRITEGHSLTPTAAVPSPVGSL